MKRIFLILLAAFLIVLPMKAYADVQTRTSGAVFLIDITGEINNGSRDYLIDGLEQAKKSGYDAVVIRIDTYGGLLSAADEMRTAILNSDMRIISYVDNRAESAGAIIALSCDEVYMAPTATIGSAEPIPNTEKSLSYVRSVLSDIAAKTGRDESILLAMADKSVVIEGLVDDSQLLNLNVDRAIEYKISDGIFTDAESLAKELFSTTKYIMAEKSFKVEALHFLSLQAMSTLLLTVGFVGMVIELFTPGFGAGGTISIIAFGLFFAVNIASGYSNWLNVVMFILGLLLLLIEMMIPGFGIPGIAGLLSLVFGIVLSMRSLNGAIMSLTIAVVASVMMVIILIKLGQKFVFLSPLTLQNATSADKGYLAVDADENLFGKKGKTFTALRPSGYVIIDGEKLDVNAQNGEFIEKDQDVEVVEIKGAKIFVRRI